MHGASANKLIHFGKIAVNANVFHRQMKPRILLLAAEKFERIVGSNPDIKIVNEVIQLVGAGPFSGKTFITNLKAKDFIK